MIFNPDFMQNQQLQRNGSEISSILRSAASSNANTPLQLTSAMHSQGSKESNRKDTSIEEDKNLEARRQVGADYMANPAPGLLQVQEQIKESKTSDASIEKCETNPAGFESEKIEENKSLRHHSVNDVTYAMHELPSDLHVKREKNLNAQVITFSKGTLTQY